MAFSVYLLLPSVPVIILLLKKILILILKFSFRLYMLYVVNKTAVIGRWEQTNTVKVNEGK